MTTLREGNQQTQGLRERKKAKTRAAIQRHALRLFEEQGYEDTTVEQIAEAAEVSPSTFFRYFPTKEEVVLYDDLDPILFAAFEAQPAELNPIQAMRRALREVFGGATSAEVDQQWERGRLIFSVPELRMRVLDQLSDTLQESAEMIARRVGRRPDDFAVHIYAGTIVGALLSAMLVGLKDTQADLIELMDASLAYLDAGMPL